MRTVKVRILPPQPIFSLLKMIVLTRSGSLNTDCATFYSQAEFLFPTQNEVSTEGGNGYGLKPEATPR
jgi:hypothetical protein